jgi:hypothetical protein
MKQIVINRCFGGFGLSNYAKLWLKNEGYEGGDYHIPRHHPLLLKCVRELGKEANGKCANLSIVEVTDKYYIEDDDGYESVITPESLMEQINNTEWKVAE